MGPLNIRLDGDNVRNAVIALQAYIEMETGEMVDEAVIGGIVFEILASEASSLLARATAEPHGVWSRFDFQRLWQLSRPRV